MTTMRIQVTGEDGIGPQARTYAEYRLFAALTQCTHTKRFRHAQVVLGHAKQRGLDAVTCTVTVALDGTDTLRVRTAGDHPYAAINRAVDRIREMDAVSRASVAPF